MKTGEICLSPHFARTAYFFNVPLCLTAMITLCPDCLLKNKCFGHCEELFLRRSNFLSFLERGE